MLIRSLKFRVHSKHADRTVAPAFNENVVSGCFFRCRDPRRNHVCKIIAARVVSEFAVVGWSRLIKTTTTMDATERINIASKFLLQSPPGEINDVLNGTRFCWTFEGSTSQLS